MQRFKWPIAGIVAGLLGITVAMSARAEVVIAGSDLAGVGLSAPGVGIGDTGSAGYNTGQVTLNIGETIPNNFSDTAQITVTNGYLGTSLGTLSSLLAQGAAGNVYFDLVSFTGGGGNGAYWDVSLVDPNNAAHTTVWNAFGDNFTGTNPFNQGVAGNSSVDASCSNNDGCDFGLWSTVTAMTPVGGDPPLGNWNVAAVTIDIGGWGQSAGNATDVIDSIHLPGTQTTSAPIPEPASLALLGVMLAAFGTIRSWRQPSTT